MQANRHHEPTAHNINTTSTTFTCQRHVSTWFQQSNPGAGQYPALPLKPELDVQTTWLTYLDSKEIPDEGANIHSVPLIPSLIEHFTGLLNWTDHDVQGLYPTPSSTSQTPAIQPLGRAAIATFYTRVSQQLEQFYSQKLADYWSIATSDGETKGHQFVAEQIECMKSECAVQIALEK